MEWPAHPPLVGGGGVTQGVGEGSMVRDTGWSG